MKKLKCHYQIDNILKRDSTIKRLDRDKELFDFVLRSTDNKLPDWIVEKYRILVNLSTNVPDGLGGHKTFYRNEYLELLELDDKQRDIE